MEINQNLSAKVDQIDHLEMERKKFWLSRENLVLEINQNLSAKVDQIDHLEMERKKVLVIKGKSSFIKKNDSKPAGFTNNPKYFGRKTSENTSVDSEKKILLLKERRNLRVEVIDQKTLLLKNIVKKELKSKIF